MTQFFEWPQTFVQDIAAKIGDVLRPYSKGSRAGLDTRDRLQRVLKQTQPIATVDLRPLHTQEGPSENGNSPSEPPVREDPTRLMLSPSWEVLIAESHHTSCTNRDHSLRVQHLHLNILLTGLLGHLPFPRAMHHTQSCDEHALEPSEQSSPEIPTCEQACPAMQVNEGYPMAAPTSTVLQATKRATRYWPLYSQVQSAVTAAFNSSAGAATAVQRDPLDDLNSLPGMLCQ